MEIYYYGRHGKKATQYTYDDFKPTDNAQPTSRLLDCDAEDSWADEEWAEPGIIDGQEATAYYLFAVDEIMAAEDSCPNNPPEDYPWDEDHCSRIIIKED